jgi:hypothetical protein
MNIEAVMTQEETPRPALRRAWVLPQGPFAAIVLVLAWGMIYYYFGVLNPIRIRQFQRADAAHGNWSDLYPRWLGARELLWQHRNPYSAEVTREIQRGFYGRELDWSNPNDPKDPEAFAYPIYVVFLIAPLLPFSFASVRPVFFCIMFLMTMASLPLWMRALRLSLSPRAAMLAWIATMSSYATIDGLHLDQLTLLVGFLVSASIAALARGRLALAGVLLALATIKPQLLILVITFILLWAVRKWRSRRRFVAGFGLAMAALLAGSEMLLPGWFQFWREAAQEYVHFHKPCLLATMLGPRVWIVVAAGGVLLCGKAFWSASREEPGSNQFNVALISALVLTALLIPNAGGGAFYNHILLLPAVLWLATSGKVLAQERPLMRFAWVFAMSVLAGEWVLALPVSLAAFIFRYSFQREGTLFVGGAELLLYVFPLALALFVLSAVPGSLRMSRCDAR